ncbi:MAG: ETC complex I subunit [Alphaproteobacteria bacterium]|nr:ETC complex I subunit [Alphaproteobacteria bacterium]
MKVRIYRPTKTATQSGWANARDWCLETEQQSARTVDPLMGWTSSADTRQQLVLHFVTRDEAVAYAEAHGYDYEVVAPRERVIRPKNYADNFRSDRRL